MFIFNNPVGGEDDSHQIEPFLVESSPRPSNNDRIIQLFPSVRPQSRPSQSAPRAGRSTGVQQGREHFNPYRFPPAGGRSRSAPGSSASRGPKCKRQTISRTNTNKIKKPIIKDVILLPDPRMSAVQRGRVREELFVRKLVGTGVEIYSHLLEEETLSLF